MIRPLADRVVLEPKEAETKTAAGLYIPDTAKEKPQLADLARRTNLWKSKSVMRFFMANTPELRLP